MSRRIFVAVGISKELQDEILSWEKKILSSRPSFARATEGRVRWLEGKNLHITLVPPWYEENIESVIRKLNAVREEFPARGGPAVGWDMEFNHVTYGPNEREPRLIWAEGQAPERLIDFKRKLTASLGQKEEKRPFRLHLTLARFRPERLSSFPIKELQERIEWRDKAKSFLLMESHLYKTGADYDVVKEFSL